jgi:hypothetical protein
MRCLISTGSPASGTDLVAPPNESPMGFQASGEDERATPCALDAAESGSVSRVASAAASERFDFAH